MTALCRRGISLLGSVVFGVMVCGCVTAASADSLSETFRKVSPAVVTVVTKQRELNPLPTLDREQFVEVAGLGSGVLVRVGGKVVVFTAAHVVQTADQVVVALSDERTIPARVRTSAPIADVALLELQVEPGDIAPVTIADSDQAQVGDRVFVVGAPHGLSQTLTVGYLGARRKSKQILGQMANLELLQTDAAINTGNSGGPMFNERGEVIGIVSHILSRSGGSDGLGFAIPTNLARQLLVDEPTGWWGVESYILTGDLAKVFNVPQDAGLLVQRLAKSSPGESLGLQAGTLQARIEGRELLVGGDIVLAVAGVKIDAQLKSVDEIRKRIRALEKNAKMTVSVLRGGKVIELSTPITEKP